MLTYARVVRLAQIVAVVGLLAGCKQIFGIDDPVPAINDASPDAIDLMCLTWRPHFFDPCQLPAPLGDLHLVLSGSPYQYDTTTGTLVDVTQAAIAIAPITIAGTNVLSISSLEIDANVRLDVTGSVPLIIASWGDVTTAGTIDAGSHTATGESGAGSNPSACLTVAAQPGADETAATLGSGGGGGGGFRGNGGMGGPGDSGSVNPGTGGSATVAPTIVRGGCSGGASGRAGPGAMAPADPSTIAAGGAGGGAIQLTSRTQVTLDTTAALLAGGGGGAGTVAGAADGGGGGGAGGYVGIEAPAITISGSPIIAANGGAGGGSAPAASAGSPGMDGPASGLAAQGAPATSCSAAGGDGGAGVLVQGASAAQSSEACGGGGGGGGTGYIYVFAPTFSRGTATISPSETVNPF